jgi:hypothetical protein
MSDPILQHVVLLRFPAALSAADEKTLLGMIAGFPEEIGLMSKCRAGTDITGDRTDGYQYLLYMEFPSLRVMQDYRAHPAHLRFTEWTHARGCTTLAFDYYLDAETVLLPER